MAHRPTRRKSVRHRLVRLTPSASADSASESKPKKRTTISIIGGSTTTSQGNVVAASFLGVGLVVEFISASADRLEVRVHPPGDGQTADERVLLSGTLTKG